MIWRVAGIVAVACATLASVGAAARAANPEVVPALHIDEWSLSTPALLMLHRVAAARDPAAGLKDVAAAIVRDRVVGAYAQHRYGDVRLFKNSRVAFAPPAAAEASLVATLHAVYREPLDHALGPDGEARFIVARHALSREQLAEMLGISSHLRLDDGLSPQRQAALQGVPLLDYRFDDGPVRRIHLLDVWQRLNVQGRHAIYALDTDYAMHEAMQLLRSHFARHWVVAHGGLTAADLTSLQQLLVDRDRRAALERLLGVAPDEHYQSPELLRLKRSITHQDIHAYYVEHQSEFARTLRVNARHIRCPDEACAAAASQALMRGVAFADVARQYSSAASNADGGSLGWITASEARNNWLAQLAFAQPLGRPTAPIREPAPAAAAAVWEILQVEQRVNGFHSADSEAVRFVASEVIARQRAAERYAALHNRLIGAAQIEVNTPILGFDAKSLKEKGQR